MNSPSTNQPLRLLAEQRGRLLERIAHQRVDLRATWEPLEQAACKADRALATAGQVRRYVLAHRKVFTVAVAVAGAALLLVRPGRTLRLFKTGFVLWRGWRAVQSARSSAPGNFWGTALDLIRRKWISAAFR